MRDVSRFERIYIGYRQWQREKVKRGQLWDRGIVPKEEVCAAFGLAVGKSPGSSYVCRVQ